MLPSTKIYFMQDVKNSKVKEPSFWWPIVEGIFAACCVVVVVLFLVFSEDISLFIRSVL
jgi:hypothetical protein